MPTAITGGRVLLGQGFDGFCDGIVVLTENGTISALLDESDTLPAHCEILDVGGRYTEAERDTLEESIQKREDAWEGQEKIEPIVARTHSTL